ncbi:hypothetical protein [Candidatus Ruthturnera calyptogenae]|uniref:hypothetical protein n=1 Tax=Candidatus Ruthturnera calyptogenae TaxID=386487 RepID=UPI00138B0B4D|nr:hypothetical protein [Candidatus Ruthturnera calyptogenae]
MGLLKYMVCDETLFDMFVKQGEVISNIKGEFPVKQVFKMIFRRAFDDSIC